VVTSGDLMSVSGESSDLEQMLTEARRMLESVRANGPASGSEDAEDDQPIESTALGGAVLVTATRGGRIERIEIDARAKRLPVEDLSEAITEAVNAALTEAATRGPQPGAEIPAIDLAALSEQVSRVQDDGMRQMARFTSVLNDVMVRLGRRS
jgi:DNA-binding protein YbaB